MPGGAHDAATTPAQERPNAVSRGLTARLPEADARGPRQTGRVPQPPIAGAAASGYPSAAPRGRLRSTRTPVVGGA